MSLGPQKEVEFLRLSYFAWLSFNVHLWMQQQSVITGSGSQMCSEPAQWFPLVNWICFQCSETRRPKDHSIPILAFRLVLESTHFFVLFEYLTDIMYLTRRHPHIFCNVDYIIYKLLPYAMLHFCGKNLFILFLYYIMLLTCSQSPSVFITCSTRCFASISSCNINLSPLSYISAARCSFMQLNFFGIGFYLSLYWKIKH